MAAKDRLKTKPKPSDQGNASIPLKVQPNINLKLPEIKIPEVKVTADTKPLLDVIVQLAARMDQQQSHIVAILNALSSKDVNVKVDVEQPKVTVQAAKRPREYYVEFVKEDGETIGMRISAE